MNKLYIVACFVFVAAACSSSSGTVGGTQDSSTDDTTKSDGPSEGGGDTSACGDKTCTGRQICTRTYTSGGPCLQCGDAGVCASGFHCSGGTSGCCIADAPTYSYACKDLPTSCAASLNCSDTCGSDLCKGAGCGQCQDISGNLVTCVCQVP